jgi:hypothetical protein
MLPAGMISEDLLSFSRDSSLPPRMSGIFLFVSFVISCPFFWPADLFIETISRLRGDEQHLHGYRASCGALGIH